MPYTSFVYKVAGSLTDSRPLQAPLMIMHSNATPDFSRSRCPAYHIIHKKVYGNVYETFI